MAKGFVKLFAKNIKKSFGPGQYQANGIEVTCVHCQHNQFEHGYAQLNTALATLFNLDFANRSATILTCHRCGYVHWFNKKVSSID
ncbi:zinc ribbon domain-containing protein [Neobacillus novalis]|uniref:Zinc ribbon domain-containing protein n=1 Tax=Neobacillus novalis TaxID=220687 RepID=A0AA95MR17_9BACI|nr:zinc ribbon domain-containing protein [Neobacillus novalis]WHY86769.1 zinc ribbon domain-containing protein [Neobacillus novalis]